MNTTPETEAERLTIEDCESLGLKTHKGFCYEEGNDYTVRWGKDGAYLSGPGCVDGLRRLDRATAFPILNHYFPESIRAGLPKNLPADVADSILGIKMPLNSGHYVPTPADCLGAGMIQPDERSIFVWVDHTMPALEQGKPDILVYLKHGDRIVFYLEEATGPYNAWLESMDGSDMVRPLVFANRDACMASLRNHLVTTTPHHAYPVLVFAGEHEGQVVLSASAEVSTPVAAPILVADGKRLGKVIISTSVEEMDEASAANARQLWDKSAPSQWRPDRMITAAYTPTQDDCRQARMHETQEPTLGVQFKWRYPNSMKFINRSVVFPNDGSNPYLVHQKPTALLSYSAPPKVKDLVFPDKDVCADFLRNYPFLVAEEGEEA